MQFKELKISDLLDLLKNKEIRAVELIKSFLVQAKNINHNSQAFQNLNEEQAVKAAQAIDEKREKGEDLPPLAGIPFLLQDNICTENILTTAGSKMLGNFKPPYNATVVQKVLDQGAILLGKTKMDEFGIEGNFKNGQNPSAQAIAQGAASFALATDTGGYLRRGAASYALLGLKPSYGLVSRYGLIANAPSMDQIGIITKNASDNALVLQNIVGHDPMDANSQKIDHPDYLQALDAEVRGLKIGIISEYMSSLDAIDQKKMQDTRQILKKLGILVEEISLPSIQYIENVYQIIASAEVSSSLARYDGVRYGFRTQRADDVNSLFTQTRSEGFGPEAKNKILLGTYLLSGVNYRQIFVQAQKIRALIQNDLMKALDNFDCLLVPEKASQIANLAGLPALAIPCGLQLIGRNFDEGQLLTISYALEEHYSYRGETDGKI